jgi:hypothetical protein
LEHISKDDIAEFNIPTGVPRKYTFTPEMGVATVQFMGDAQAIAEATAAVGKQATG